MLAARNICNKINVRHIRQLGNTNVLLCDKRIEENDHGKEGGFAKAYDKFEHLNAPVEEKPQTFASLLRHSKLIDVKMHIYIVSFF